MLRFREFLEEKVLNIGLNPDHERYRDRYRDQIHDILHQSYKPIGGYMSHPSGTKEESEAIHTDITNSHIKAIHRSGKVTAVRLYRSQYGRKVVSGGSDGSDEGKSGYKKILHDDNKQRRAWGETSGAPEKIQRKMGVPVVPSSMAPKLTGKEDVKIVDNERYERKIGPHVHTKVIMGHPKV